MRPENARAGTATLAFVTAWAALLPMTSLLDKGTWVRPALGLSLAIVMAGMAARTLTRRTWVIVAAQFLVGFQVFFMLHGRGHLWHWLPTKEAFLTINYVLYDARETVMAYAAPAPTNRGMIVATSLIVGVIVLAVDALAVTRQSPAAAGLPLLAAYLITATNTPAMMSWLAFVVPAGLWLALLARTGVSGLRRWATAIPLRLDRNSSSKGKDPVDGFAAAARNLGLMAVAAALIVPMILPHLPTRFLGDGLGRSDSGTGAGGSFSLNTTLDLAKSLESQSDDVVLRYRTSDPVPGPLKVATLSRYDANGQFREAPTYPATTIQSGQEIPGSQPPAGLAPKDVKKYTFSMISSSLARPQIALPYGTSVLDLPDSTKGILYPDGTIQVDHRVRDFDADFFKVTPTEAQLNTSQLSVQGPTRTDPVTADDYTVEPLAEKRLRDLLDKIVPRNATDFEAAVAIQDHLRSSEYTYSLKLIGPTKDANGRLVNLDPVSQFLLTKQGYCQQFATAMVMLAREYGIPARMAVGFLPGALVNGERTVRAADAHAWPELYFANYGWLRFEPTPSSRSGSVPDYAETQTTTPTTPTSSPTGGASASPTTRAPNRDDLATPDLGNLDRPVWQRVQDLPRLVWIALALLLGLLAAAVVPVTARLRRRRLLNEATDDAERVEILWQDLVSRIGDLGISTPDSLTPRQTHEYLRQRGTLEPESAAALGRVISTVERARYAPPSTALLDPAKDVETVVDAVGSSRQWPTRIRAGLLPTTGVRLIGGGAARVIAVPGRAIRAIIRALPRR